MSTWQTVLLALVRVKSFRDGLGVAAKLIGLGGGPLCEESLLLVLLRVIQSDCFVKGFSTTWLRDWNGDSLDL